MAAVTPAQAVRAAVAAAAPAAAQDHAVTDHPTESPYAHGDAGIGVPV